MTNVLIRAEYPDKSALELDIELEDGTPFHGVEKQSLIDYLKSIVPDSDPVRITVNGAVVHQLEVA